MAVRVIQARPIVGNTVAPPAQKLCVAAYARISTDDDSQETSLAGQMAYFENLIKGNDEWSYAGLYFDDGISGTSTKKRDGFNRMMADCEAGLIPVELNDADRERVLKLVTTGNVTGKANATMISGGMTEYWFEDENGKYICGIQLYDGLMIMDDGMWYVAD